MSNGYHVAIESVKRTQSITQIIRDYYCNFLKELVEDQAEIDSDSEEVDKTMKTMKTMKKISVIQGARKFLPSPGYAVF